MPDHAIGHAMHSSRSHDAVIRVYDGAGNVIEQGELAVLPIVVRGGDHLCRLLAIGFCQLLRF